MSSKGLKHKVKETKQIVKGICRVCGCTDDQKCWDGCDWTDRNHTLCSRCEKMPKAEQERHREWSINHLSERLAQYQGQVDDLKQRLDVLKQS